MLNNNKKKVTKFKFMNFSWEPGPAPASTWKEGGKVQLSEDLSSTKEDQTSGFCCIRGTWSQAFNDIETLGPLDHWIKQVYRLNATCASASPLSKIHGPVTLYTSAICTSELTQMGQMPECQQFQSNTSLLERLRRTIHRMYKPHIFFPLVIHAATSY